MKESVSCLEAKCAHLGIHREMLLYNTYCTDILSQLFPLQALAS